MWLGAINIPLRAVNICHPNTLIEGQLYSKNITVSHTILHSCQLGLYQVSKMWSLLMEECYLAWEIALYFLVDIIKEDS